MYRYVRASICAALLIGLAGCSGTLKVFDAQQQEIKGVPFRATEVYVKKGMHTLLASGGDCTPADFVEIVSLPTGAQFYITAKSSSFAKTAFHVKFTDEGALSEVGLDSEPAAAESIKATTDLLKTIVAAAGGGAVRSAAAPRAQLPACDAAPKQVRYIRFDEFIKIGN